MSDAKITIGVPVYNGTPSIRECLDCLIGQDHGNLRIIVTDNNSTDDTGDIVKDYSSLHDHIEYFRHPESVDVTKNFLTSLRMAKTEYFAWRADDDLSDKNYFSTLLECLEQNKQAVGTIPPSGITHPCPELPKERLEAMKVILKYRSLLSFYGLWRTSYLLETAERIYDIYPNPVGFEILLVLSTIFNNGFASATGTTLFYRRVRHTRIVYPLSTTRMRSVTGRVNACRYYYSLKKSYLKCLNMEIKQHQWTKDEKKTLKEIVRMMGFPHYLITKTIFRRMIRMLAVGYFTKRDLIDDY